MSEVRIGISGWRYEPWRQRFYPEELPQRRELEYASARFASIELNGSFYSLQHPQSYKSWRQQTPPGFVFAVKGSRYITHILRLRGVEQALSNFFASGLFNLQDKLGPLLWQFPPSQRYDEKLFENFFKLLPRDTEAAAAMARRRDRNTMRGRARLAAGPPRALRHAVEIRHASFEDAGYVQLLREHGIAAVFADTAGRWPYFEDLTADFVYLRLHGDVEIYTSGYTEAALKRWARRIGHWREGGAPPDAKTIGGGAARQQARDVYCYFDNDVKVRAPYDARRLAELLGVAAGLPALEPYRAPRGGWARGLGPRGAQRNREAPATRR